MYLDNLINQGVLPPYLISSNNRDLKQLYLDALLQRESNKYGRSISYKELMDSNKDDDIE